MKYRINPLTGKSQPKLASDDPRIVEAVREVMGMRPALDTDFATGDAHLAPEDIADEVDIDPSSPGLYCGTDDALLAATMPHNLLMFPAPPLRWTQPLPNASWNTINEQSARPVPLRERLEEAKSAPISHPQITPLREAAEEFQEAPTYVSPILAYRAWKSIHRGVEGITGVAWPPHEPLVACCTGEGQGSHQTPGLDCYCGMWGFKTVAEMESAVRGYDGIPLVFGRVYLWGRVIEWEHGWRAQYAYPAEFWTDRNDLAYLRDYYGIPIRTLEPKYREPAKESHGNEPRRTWYSLPPVSDLLEVNYSNLGADTSAPQGDEEDETD